MPLLGSISFLPLALTNHLSINSQASPVVHHAEWYNFIVILGLPHLTKTVVNLNCAHAISIVNQTPKSPYALPALSLRLRRLIALGALLAFLINLLPG
jgi:hypothetical protein